MASATVPNTGTSVPAELDRLAGLARVGPAHHLGARPEHPGPVPAALGAGDALHDDPALRRSGRSPSHAPVAAAEASSAARRAASSMVATCSTTGISAASSIRRPSAALLPSRRTTIGWLTCSPRAVEHPDRGHDPVRDRVARGDPAEHVDQHAADRRVGQHDLQAVRHHLGRGAAADVEEVRRPDPAELLARVGDHVEGGHDQARPRCR